MNALLVLFAVISVAFGAPTDCQQAAGLYKCLADVGIDIKNLTIDASMFPVDQAELDDRCSKYMPFWKCAEDFMERCPHILPPMVVDFYREESKQERSFCKPGNEQTERYFKHSECIKNNFDLLEECGVVTSLSSDQDPIETTCRQFRHFFGCYFHGIGNKCGEGAVDVLQEMSGPRKRFFKKLCKDSEA